MSSALEQALRDCEQDYESLLGLMHLVPVGFARLDSTGRFDVVNPEMSRLMQAAAPENGLGNFFDFLAAVAPELRTKALAQDAANGPVFEDARIVIPNAGVEALSCTLMRAHRGAFFVMLSDATAIFRRERGEARPLADEASRAKREFLAASQRGMAQPAQALDDILDTARIGTGEIELKDEAFELKPLVGEAVERIRAAAEAKSLTLSQEFDRIGPGAFRGDPTRLGQILDHFLSNAVKFTQAGGVKVKVRGMPGPSGRWRLRLEVRDSGVGVADEAKRRLLQPLVQPETSVSRSFGGVGLNLARGLAELMGGGCGVADRPGGGSIFWVEVVLPVAAAEPERAESNAVLVVDDGKVNTEIVRLVLSAAGFEVHVAVDGCAAVEAARARDYALILMDIHMPRMDGFAATRAIRALPGAAARVPVIGMSAATLPETQAEGREAGMNDYVVKPLAPAKLRALASKWARAAVA